MEGKPLAFTVAGVGVAVIVVGTALLYFGEPPPTPERPKPPPPPEVFMNSELKYNTPVWRALIESDAKAYQVPVPSVDELARPNPYFEELKGSRRLKPKASMETAHLRLAVEVSKRKANIEGQSFSSDHLVLRIENRTPHHVAYRVKTNVTNPERCTNKSELPQNVLVLKPHQTIRRTECLYRSDESVEVTYVEALELPPLSAYYVSRLPPSPVLYDARTSGGHVPLAGSGCPQTFSWRDIQEGIERREFGWKDVIDFYARHNCDEYSFFRGYRYRDDAAGVLPARPMD